MLTLSRTVNFKIEFSEPIALKLLNSHKHVLNKRGIYLLLNGLEEDPIYEARNVFYIGKAISETIFTRAKKHVDSITMAKNRNNNPKTRPGKKFKEYSKLIGNNLNKLCIVPGYMHDCMSFEVSCAEEWLIWNYYKAHGVIPSANTYAAKNL